VHTLERSTKAEISVYFMYILVRRLSLKTGLVLISNKKILLFYIVKLNPLIPKKKLLSVVVNTPASLIAPMISNPTVSVITLSNAYPNFK
jgi:hypothetical protein